MKNPRYIRVFFLTSILCIAALLAAAFLPQSRIAENISRSLPGLVNEGTYPRLKEGYRSAMLDNYTDSLTLMEVLSMQGEDLSTVFSNPLYLQKEDPMESLVNYAENPDLLPDGYYVRYWMGFRASLRLLFSFLTYSQIRRLNFLVLVCLAGFSMLSVAKKVNNASALGLGLCLLLMRPLIIARSFQYTTCFLIALAAMPFVPLIRRRKACFGLFFMVVGMLTQFFDFYSVPVLTLCLPLLFHFAIQVASRERERERELRELATASLSWMGGYVLFWLEKLLLSTVFSPINGFSNGFAEFLYWMNRHPASGGNKLLYVYRRVWNVVCPSLYASLVLGSFAVVLAIYAFVAIRRGMLSAKHLWNNGIAGTMLLPLIWMGVAATPTGNHAFFQYRSIAAVFWGLCLLVTASADAPRFKGFLSSKKNGKIN